MDQTADHPAATQEPDDPADWKAWNDHNRADPATYDDDRADVSALLTYLQDLLPPAAFKALIERGPGFNGSTPAGPEASAIYDAMFSAMDARIAQVADRTDRLMERHA
jgi:hypothetical protein